LSTARERKTLEQVRRQLTEAQSALLAHLQEQEQQRGRQAEAARRLAELDEQRRRLSDDALALEKRGRLDEGERRQADLSLEEIRRRTERLVKQMEAVRRLPSLQRTLTYRTPVAQALQSEELQFECGHGRVTFLDVEALVREIRQR